MSILSFKANLILKSTRYLIGGINISIYIYTYFNIIILTLFIFIEIDII